MFLKGWEILTNEKYVVYEHIKSFESHINLYPNNCYAVTLSFDEKSFLAHIDINLYYDMYI